MPHGCHFGQPAWGCCQHCPRKPCHTAGLQATHLVPELPSLPPWPPCLGRHPPSTTWSPWLARRGRPGLSAGHWARTSTSAESQQEGHPRRHTSRREMGMGRMPTPQGERTHASFLAAASGGGRQRQCPQVAERDCQGTSRPVPREGLLSKLWYPQAGTSTCKPVFTAPQGPGVPPPRGLPRSPVLLAPGRTSPGWAAAALAA